MRRRSLLGALAATTTGGLAGCGGVVGYRRPPKVVRIEETTSRGVGFEAEVVRRRATTEHPPVLRLRWRATDGPVTLPDVTDFVDRHYSQPPAEGEPSALRLMNDRWREPRHRVRDDCWRLSSPAPRPAAEPEPTWLAPGESVSKTYDLWSTQETTGCLPVGVYRFGERETTPRWRLELELSR